MQIRVYIILLIFISLGCREINKPEAKSQELLECIVWHFIDQFELEKNDNIFLSEMPTWTDSSSYISIIADTDGIRSLDGEYWMAKLYGFNIYKYSGTSKNSFIENNGNNSFSIPNKLKWEKVTFKVSEELTDKITPPYDPPKIEFIYNTNANYVEHFFALGSLLKTLNYECKLCK